MPQINVTIDGRSYRMACGEGEEAHLTGLAATLDGRIGEMRKSFGEIGDMRLQVMAALTIVDELAELRMRYATLETDVAALRAAAEAAERGRAEDAERAAVGIGRAAEHIGKLADALGGVGPRT
ncbi:MULTISPECIES: cell division protein ZapA [Methylobacterium]|uniref:cell division protein ZapA n=1 Tax=Methylobacterium TaxID=407 RepID=UPI0005BB35F3|nr:MULTISPECIES: cell division protein ZapA [Methylobacterium]KOX55940.1 cell division protein ZapA [Streptomyces purpurogeneiscleroticus]MDH3027432.1 cell division protein ZapA [Methylobacterium fujisawaense]SFU57442.1 cell division protein ZapA [Methylobacterium sp. UNCCL125]